MKNAMIILIFTLLSACTNQTDVGQEGDILDIAQHWGWETASVYDGEVNVLGELPGKCLQKPLHAITFLHQNDRLMVVRWLDVDTERICMSELKQSLFRRFSLQAVDIVDDRIQPVQSFAIEILAFTDPSIFSNRIMIAAVGSKIYEFHVSQEQTDAVMELLLAIARID